MAQINLEKNKSHIRTNQGMGIVSYEITVSAEKMWEYKHELKNYYMMAQDRPEMQGLVYRMAKLLGLSLIDLYQAEEQEEFTSWWKPNSCNECPNYGGTCDGDPDPTQCRLHD